MDKLAEIAKDMSRDITAIWSLSEIGRVLEEGNLTDEQGTAVGVMIYRTASSLYQSLCEQHDLIEELLKNEVSHG